MKHKTWDALFSRNGKISILIGLFVAVIGLGALVTQAETVIVWSTNFENGSTLPLNNNVDWLYNVTGVNNKPPEAALSHDEHQSGIYALKYEGTDMSKASSYAYMTAFKVSIPVTADTNFSYWMKPENDLGKCVALDLHFTDGSRLSNSGAVDSNGRSVAARDCHNNAGGWNEYRVNLGQWAAGRTVDKIWVVYDKPAEVGNYRGYIDDITFSRNVKITTSKANTTAGTNGQYSASYWNYNGEPTVPSTSPTYQTATSTISYDWAGGSPAPAVNNDRFVAVYKLRQEFDSGTYLFSLRADDGVRLYVDDKPLINQWRDTAPTEYNAYLQLGAGKHDIRVEYYERGGGATLKFGYQKTVTPITVKTEAATAIPTPTATVPAATPVVTTPVAVPAAPAPVSTNPLFGLTLFNNTTNDLAYRQMTEWRTSRPADAQLINKIAANPRADWMGEWSGDIRQATDNIVTAAAANKATPVLIAYNIPNRDCGNYSAGGLGSASDYINWINGMANGINGRKTIVILEPDALGLVTCLNSADQQTRYNMLSQATDILRSRGAIVYIEASTWVSPAEMAGRLKSAGLGNANGFSLNVSGFNTTASMKDYGSQLSSLTGNKHFVIDTSRNGNGPSPGNEWCNPMGRAIGEKPVIYQSGVLDALLWMKKPGESDGTCNGGPSAGAWWPDYALGLAQRASY